MLKLLQRNRISLTHLSFSLLRLLQSYSRAFSFLNPRGKTPNLTHSTLFNQLILLLLICINSFSYRDPSVETKVLNGSIFLVNLFIFIFSRHLNNQAFKLYYNCFIVVYEIVMLWSEQMNPFLAWIGIQVFPLLGLSLTQCKSWFIIHTSVQIMYFNQYFALQITKALAELSPHDFTQKIIYGSNFLILIKTVLIFLISDSSEELGKKVLFREQEGKEVQKQKEFLLGFSHEFRNLTHSIVGNIKLANLEQLPQKIRTLLIRAEVSGELLLQYINNILDSGKLEVNELEITPTRTRIYDILEQVWRVSSEMLKFKGLTGSIKISKSVPSTLYIDHYRLLQILFNLITNGIKYTNKGSVTVNIEWISQCETISDSCFEPLPFNDGNEYDEGLFEKRQAFTVFDDSLLVLDFNNTQIKPNQVNEVNNSIENGILKVTVTDSGCGILSTNLPKLWDIFWKPANGTSGRKYGTGLGLFITKRLCNSMKGDIKAYTRAGKGSSFVFCVSTRSVISQRPREVSFEAHKGLIQARGMKAMVVDDVEFNNIILKNFLEKLNIEVVQMAEDGVDAYTKFIREVNQQRLLQVITMDIDMPKLDGKRAVEMIREYELAHNLPACIIIMVSGDCSESDIRECIDKKGKIRADGFIKKPANMEELARVIGNSLL